MEFGFSEDQLLLQTTVRDFLTGACPVEHVRAQWQTETGRSDEFWAQLAEIGVPGLLVPEAQGGLGMNELDLVLILEETGRAALAEPVIATAAVGVPMLARLGALGDEWLPKVADGAARLAVEHPVNAFTADAHVADLLLLVDGDDLHAVSPADATLTAQPCDDPSRRIFSITWKPSAATKVASGAAGRALQDAALDRGALACAAESLGVTDQLIAMAVEYATERKQFGVPIGSFQAIKHMLANVKVRLEYARSLVYRAAYSVAHDAPGRATDVSAAKAQASEAAALGASVSLQVYGALGYTYEQDLHVFMRRAWTLDRAWGNQAFHRARVADAVIDGARPAEPFGYSAPGA